MSNPTAAEASAALATVRFPGRATMKDVEIHADACAVLARFIKAHAGRSELFTQPTNMMSNRMPAQPESGGG